MFSNRFKKRCTASPPAISIDDYSFSQVEQNDYVLSSDLRVVIGDGGSGCQDDNPTTDGNTGSEMIDKLSLSAVSKQNEDDSESSDFSSPLNHCHERFSVMNSRRSPDGCSLSTASSQSSLLQDISI